MQPNVNDALLEWLEPVTFIKITEDIVDFEKVKIETAVESSAMIQQFSINQLAIKPEGQRSWQWWMIHTIDDIYVVPDDIIRIGSIHYKIMEANDYSRNGYFEYHAIRTRE